MNAGQPENRKQLFVQFLVELCDEARKNNHKPLVQCYTKALTNVNRYPLPLYTGQDALVIEGVGMHSLLLNHFIGYY
jgi:hypothetical protein